MKPLVRWTIGKHSNQNSFDCLKLSVSLFKKLYGDKFDLVVCYNNLDQNQIDDLPLIKRINQLDYNPFNDCYPCVGNPAWKLYPPRLSILTHEIFIDNDVLLFKPLEEIEEFLNSSIFITTEAYLRSYSERYQNLICKNFNINTGIIGIPPKFDLKKHIVNTNFVEWNNFYDEQSIIAIILQNEKHIIIKKEKIEVACGEKLFNKGSHGIHLVGLNHVEKKHWNNLLSFL